MTIKFENGNINAYATKTFIKRAQTFGTPEFYEWRAACKEFGKEVKLVVDSKRKRTNENKNLTFENMVIYMNNQKNSSDYLKAFEKVKQCSRVQTNPTKYILDWFKATFPNYKETLKVIVDEKNANEEKDNVVEMADKVSA